MSVIKKTLLWSILLVLLFFLYCEPTEPVKDSEYIEPELILIDKDLTFINGPSWDPTFYEMVDILPFITLNPYSIGKYELTNNEYLQFVKEGGYVDSAYWSEAGWKTKNDSNWTGPMYWDEGDPPWANDPYSNQSNTPVHGISFYEADAYCAWLSAKTGKNYFVPLSTQWVRAAKGPDPGTKYTWGNDVNDVNAYYPYPISKNYQLVSVLSYPNGKSYDGCYNMIGNAYEICFHISDEWGDFPLIYSFYNLECSEPNCMKETMTTTGGGSIERHTRRYAVGLRICRD